jgi:soluble lytic murein transglycosylase-like protein
MVIRKIYISLLTFALIPVHSNANELLSRKLTVRDAEFSSFQHANRSSALSFETSRFVNPTHPISRAGIRAQDEAGPCIAAAPDSTSRIVRLIAKEEGFDEDLAEAVAWAESDLGQNQGPTSAGALGIMQLMEGTASDLGVKDRCNAEENIRGGIQYLKQLRGKFPDPLLMLAAYNAGAGNVYKANGIPTNAETSQYVVKILNRWKLSKVVNAPTISVRTASINTPVPTNAVSKQTAWKDGHVFDFGE